MNDHSRYFADLAVNANCGTKANIPDFQYRHLGSMANVGEWKSVIDTTNIGNIFML